MEPTELMSHESEISLTATDGLHDSNMGAVKDSPDVLFDYCCLNKGDVAIVVLGRDVRSGSVDLNRLTPIDKCEGARLNRCRVVHGCGRRLRRTHDAVGNSGRTNELHFTQLL